MPAAALANADALSDTLLLSDAAAAVAGEELVVAMGMGAAAADDVSAWRSAAVPSLFSLFCFCHFFSPYSCL